MIDINSKLKHICDMNDTIALIVWATQLNKIGLKFSDLKLDADVLKVCENVIDYYTNKRSWDINKNFSFKMENNWIEFTVNNKGGNI